MWCFCLSSRGRWGEKQWWHLIQLPVWSGVVRDRQRLHIWRGRPTCKGHLVILIQGMPQPQAVGTFNSSWASLRESDDHIVMSSSATEPCLQHHAGEEPWHGGWGEEEVCHEASPGGPSGHQEVILRQLHRHLQTVRIPWDALLAFLEMLRFNDLVSLVESHYFTSLVPLL